MQREVGHPIAQCCNAQCRAKRGQGVVNEGVQREDDNI